MRTITYREPIPAMLGAKDSMTSDEHASLSDAADAAEAASRAKADADDETRAIREAINALAKRGRLWEGQVVAILTTLQARIAETGWKHTAPAVSADEALTDCIHWLERAE
jgi:hypothetical protein